jgi:uncharacterized glyoxalase superfamily protein PhnB
MELYDGASYRINIEGTDSTLVVDSYRGVIKANLVDSEDRIIVDSNNRIFRGDLSGNIVNDIGAIVVDSEEKLFFGNVVGNVVDELGNIVVDNLQQIFHGNVIGDVVNDIGAVVVDSNEKLFFGNVVGNVVDELGNVIVNTSDKIFHGNVVSSSGNTIVDAENETFVGNFLGNIVDPTGVIVYDYINNSLWLENLNVSSLIDGNLKGNVYSNNGTLSYDAHSNSSTLDRLTVNSVEVNEIITGNFTGNIFDALGNRVYNIEDGNIHVENITVNNSIYGGLRGNIFNSRGDTVFDFLNNYLYLDNVTTIGNNFLIKVFGNYEQEIIYSDSKIGFSSNKSYNFDAPTTEDFYTTFDYDQITIVSNSIVENKNSAGIIGFYGFTDEKSLNENDTKFFGSLGFIANYTDSNSSTIPADFIILNGKDNYNFQDYNTAHDYVKDNCLVFDHKGVLSAPVIKTGVHANTSTVVNPEKGMIVFNDSTGKFQGYTGTTWVDLH